MKFVAYIILVAVLFTVYSFAVKNNQSAAEAATAQQITPAPAPLPAEDDNEVNKENSISVAGKDYADPQKVVEYARTFIGTPYVYGSTNPAVGFDCSGFVNHVAHHFNIDVPRSSVDFTNYGTEVNREAAMPGDFILFTGTDASARTVGHIGIITENDSDGIEFIHSSSGKSKGVTLSPLEGYYETRFVKVIRIV